MKAEKSPKQEITKTLPNFPVDTFSFSTLLLLQHVCVHPSHSTLSFHLRVSLLLKTLKVLWLWSIIGAQMFSPETKNNYCWKVSLFTPASLHLSLLSICFPTPFFFCLNRSFKLPLLLGPLSIPPLFKTSPSTYISSAALLVSFFIPFLQSFVLFDAGLHVKRRGKMSMARGWAAAVRSGKIRAVSWQFPLTPAARLIEEGYAGERRSSRPLSGSADAAESDRSWLERIPPCINQRCRHHYRLAGRTDTAIGERREQMSFHVSPAPIIPFLYSVRRIRNRLQILWYRFLFSFLFLFYLFPNFLSFLLPHRCFLKSFLPSPLHFFLIPFSPHSSSLLLCIPGYHLLSPCSFTTILSTHSIVKLNRE